MAVSKLAPGAQVSGSFTVQATAAPAGRYYAAFSIPGRDFQQATRRKPDGGIETLTFATPEEAMAAAGLSLCEALNLRTRAGRSSYGYMRIGGRDLAKRLAELKMTPSVLSRITGWTHRVVMQWLDGEQNAPHSVRVLLEIFRQHPAAMATATSITDRAMDEDANRRAIAAENKEIAANG